MATWSRIWWLRYRINGKEHRESSHSTSKREVEKILARRQAEHEIGHLTAPDSKRVTFTDLADMIRNDYKVRGRRSTVTLEGSLANLEASFGGCRALAITSDRITAYERERLDAGAARATVNKELAALRRTFNLAVKAQRPPVSESRLSQPRTRTTPVRDSSRSPTSVLWLRNRP
jgi:hypothetical protein